MEARTDPHLDFQGQDIDPNFFTWAPCVLPRCGTSLCSSPCRCSPERRSNIETYAWRVRRQRVIGTTLTSMSWIHLSTVRCMMSFGQCSGRFKPGCLRVMLVAALLSVTGKVKSNRGNHRTPEPRPSLLTCSFKVRWSSTHQNNKLENPLSFSWTQFDTAPPRAPSNTSFIEMCVPCTDREICGVVR